jgi:hypothetical protein
LHPADHARLASVQALVREDARKALTARMDAWNAKSSRFRRNGPRKEYRIAQSDWWIEFFADTENSVPPGDVEIHSELNEAPQPGYRGAKTTLLDREPSITSARVVRDRQSTRRLSDRIFAVIKYQDDLGPQIYQMTREEISVGRGGGGQWVDLSLHTDEEVSREHLRLRRIASNGTFAIVDHSRNGTWVNGRRLTRGKEEAMPDRSEIRVAERIKLRFEVKR